MSSSGSEDPLARYLEDMLSEPDPSDRERSQEQSAGAIPRAPALASEQAPVAESKPLDELASNAGPDDSAIPVDASVAWWGFGVAHLILVLSGESVESIRENIPDQVELTPDRLVQGKYEMDGQSRLLVDVARLVLPEDHLSRLPTLNDRAQGILHVRDSGISLLCGSEPMPVELEEDEIRWRETASSRRWMAGTVMSRSMVVLDVPGLIESVIAGE